MMRTSNLFSLAWKIQQTKSPVKSAKHHQWWQALDRAFSFLLWGNQEEERKSVHFCSINAKGMLIFIVADIWNCYNMDMKKTTNMNLNLGGKLLCQIVVLN